MIRRRKNAAPQMPSLQLSGSRIVVRTPQTEDAAQWISVREKNRKILQPLEPEWGSGRLTAARFRKRLERQALNWKADRSYAFLVFLKENDALIGGININNVCRDAAQFASLGYWLDCGHEGRGYMTEALSLVIRHAFTKLKLHRLNAGTLPHNKRSIRLLTRLGFKKEGFAEKYLEINGDWQDHILFGLNVENWKKR